MFEVAISLYRGDWGNFGLSVTILYAITETARHFVNTAVYATNMPTMTGGWNQPFSRKLVLFQTYEKFWGR